MTKRRPRSHGPRSGIVGRLFVVASLLVTADATARAEAAPCSPPCANGVTCNQGTCVADVPPQQRPHRFFHIAPYLGVHSYRGDSGTNVKPGLHFGGLAGFRLSELVSINGELAFDSVDLNGPRDERFTELDSTATLSPLVSITAGKVDLVFGPKLGAWVASYNQSSVSRGDGSGTFWGLDLGTSFATLTQVSRRLWLGGLASFDLRIYRKICFTPTGGIEGCASTDLPPADKVVSFSALLMFSP